MRRVNFIHVLLIFTFTSTHAEELTSSVQVFNAIKWAQVQEKAKNDGQVSSLKALVEIIYDPMVGVRWERADYFEAINEKWKTFRSHFCPSSLQLCTLAPNIDDFSQIDHIIDKLTSENDGAILNKEIADTGLYLTPNLNFPGITGKDDRANFSMRIAEIDVNAESKRLEFRDIKARSATRLISLENAVLYDLRSYELGFTQKSVPAFFAVDQSANGYLQIEKIKMAAMDFAINWRRVVQHPTPYKAVNAEEILLQRLYKKSEKVFEDKYAQLRNRLNPIHEEDIGRFLAERGQGRYPLEVFQAVAYEHLLKLATQQVEFYQWAQQFRKNFDNGAIVVESLLNLQNHANPELFYYLLHRIAVIGDAEILSQTVTQRQAQQYLVKIVEALRGQGKYGTNKNAFRTLSKKIDYSLLLEADFLLTYRSYLYDELDRNNFLTADQLRAAPLEMQRRIIDEFVSVKGLDSEGDIHTKPFLMGILRLAGAIFLGMDQETSKIYSAIIYDVNLTDAL